MTCACGHARRCGRWREWRRATATAVTCAGVVATATCGQESEAPPQNPPEASGDAVQVPVERPAWSSQLDGIREPTRTVIRDLASWQEFWDSFAGARVPRPDPPDIDFDTSIVIIAAMGQQSTGGYDIAIENVYEEDDTTRVEVVETVPAGGCLTAQVITSPTTAVLIPSRTGEVEFVERRETRSC